MHAEITTHPTALTALRKALKRRVKDNDADDFQIAASPTDPDNLYLRLVRIQVSYAAAVDLTVDIVTETATLQLWRVAKGRIIHPAYTPTCYRSVTLDDLDAAVDAAIDIAHQLAGPGASPRPFPSLAKTTIAEPGETTTTPSAAA